MSQTNRNVLDREVRIGLTQSRGGRSFTSTVSRREGRDCGRPIECATVDRKGSSSRGETPPIFGDQLSQRMFIWFLV